MDIPPVDSIEGAYWYFIALLLGLVLVIGLYIVGMVAGVVPDFAQLF